MAANPPESLVAELESLALATEAQLRAVAGRVRKLARDLPLFDSVWVDALANARILTPYQAREINAGRGEHLAVGPYVLVERVSTAGLNQAFLARHRQSGLLARLVIYACGEHEIDSLTNQLSDIVARAHDIDTATLAVPREVGKRSGDVWITSDHLPGTIASDWMIRRGRLPPEAVLEIARQMAAALALVEERGLLHGDISAQQLVLRTDGRIALTDMGLRAILRPTEGFARANVPVEALDYLAPERVARGSPPTVASDIYACGCLWWHLLTGRPPLAGGSPIAKLNAAQRPRIIDAQRLAPGTPQPLARAIAACLRVDAGERPDSFQRVASSLGPPTVQGRATLVSILRGDGPRRKQVRVAATVARQRQHSSVWMAALAGCVLALGVTLWPAWSRYFPWHAAPPAHGATVETTNGAAPDSDALNTTNEQAHGMVGAEPPQSAASPPLTGETSSGQPVSTGEPGSPNATRPTLVLPAEQPLHIEQLRLIDGQLVTGPRNHRPTVVLDHGELQIAAEGVRFVGIDFVAHRADPENQHAFLRVTAWQAEFIGCTFRCRANAAGARPGIVWAPGQQQSGVAQDLATGDLRFTNCVFQSTSAAIACAPARAVALDFTNCLHLGPGPLVSLADVPPAEAPVLLALERVTMRQAAALVECGMIESRHAQSSLVVGAQASALVPRDDGALVIFRGPDTFDAPWPALRWRGQGSILAGRAPVAGWRDNVAGWKDDAGLTYADESALQISGLVRGDVRFAGPIDAGTSASQIVAWQVPVLSADPPGIDAAQLTAATAAGHE